MIPLRLCEVLPQRNRDRDILKKYSLIVVLVVVVVTGKRILMIFRIACRAVIEDCMIRIAAYTAADTILFNPFQKISPSVGDIDIHLIHVSLVPAESVRQKIYGFCKAQK